MCVPRRIPSHICRSHQSTIGTPEKRTNTHILCDFHSLVSLTIKPGAPVGLTTYPTPASFLRLEYGISTPLHVQRIYSRYISEADLVRFLERVFPGNYWYELVSVASMLSQPPSPRACLEAHNCTTFWKLISHCKEFR